MTTTAQAKSHWFSSFGELWTQLGPETRDTIVELLPQDWSFAGKRVLDFGCGRGRTLRYFLPEAADAEFWGVDIDKSSIDEVKATMVPPLHVMQSGYTPPLDLESGSFDLAWAISVFTHLTDNSIPWLLELRRLLKPGGLLIATYMGRWTSELIAGEPWDDDRIGMNVLRQNNPWSEGGPLVLISDWWMREHWGRAFDVLDIAPRVHNQSWALLRKRDLDLTADDLQRPAEDPREYIALRHNLDQVQRELYFYEQVVEALGRQHADQIDALRRTYEGSLSWQVTQPLRGAMRVVRSREKAQRSRSTKPRRRTAGNGATDPSGPR